MSLDQWVMVVGMTLCLAIAMADPPRLSPRRAVAVALAVGMLSAVKMLQTDAPLLSLPLLALTWFVALMLGGLLGANEGFGRIPVRVALMLGFATMAGSLFVRL